MYKVFVSYNTEQAEASLVLRLQTLASTLGVIVYVPPRLSQKIPTLPKNIQDMIGDSDCVLAFLTKKLTPQVISEITFAAQKNKMVIPIVDEGITANILTNLNIRPFYLDRKQPWIVEQQILKFLQQGRMSKANQEAVYALSAVLLGLLALQELTKG